MNDRSLGRAASSRRWSSLDRWLPARPSIDRTEALRASAGAAIGILVTGLVGLAFADAYPGTIWLMAPMGASAVLLFGVPSSPLAQPWSLIAGNTVAALVGISAARWIPEPAIAATIAIFVAIGLMLALRCLHPPSGAVSLVAVLGGHDVASLGYAFVVAPVLLNGAVLLAAALVYNNATGRRYPHNQRAGPPPDTSAQAADRRRTLQFDDRDIATALTEYNQVLDVSVDDLGALFRKVEAEVFRRNVGPMQCRDLIGRPTPSVQYATELGDAWETMQKEGLTALPVVDSFGHVVGVATRGDFVRHAEVVDERHVAARLVKLLRRTEGMYSDKPEVVGQIMTSPARTAKDTSSIVELVPLMAGEGYRHVPIVDARGRLAGMAAQSDVIAALYESTLRHAMPIDDGTVPA